MYPKIHIFFLYNSATIEPKCCRFSNILVNIQPKLHNLYNQHNHLHEGKTSSVRFFLFMYYSLLFFWQHIKFLGTKGCFKIHLQSSWRILVEFQKLNQVFVEVTDKLKLNSYVCIYTHQCIVYEVNLNQCFTKMFFKFLC